ncbi:class I SAM-dependent DNA methyltransferase [Candidatus Lokiarchaeum ossiferum]|uniref:class I SAM-dependent DNA methyltransferase n=1 Tax=Candidatus Lokiarchaeum ossiferum TaxID=2951803 RepID=UPI00352F2472
MVIKNSVKSSFQIQRGKLASIPQINKEEFLHFYHRIFKETNFHFQAFLKNNTSPASLKSTKNSEFHEDILEKHAIQATYLILNKIFSYYVIRSQIYHQFGRSISKLYDPSLFVPFSLQLQKNFAQMSSEYEFAPIFHENNWDRGYTFPEGLESSLITFINHFTTFDITQLSDDFIAELFQKLIPIKNRKALGQIYTPGDIAELMAELCIRKPDDVILDPACGCGTLLRKAYDQKKKLAQASSLSLSHTQLLDQIWGVEVDEFPAHLAMMTLAYLDLSQITHVAGVLLEDFMQMGPMEKYIVRTKDLSSGKLLTREMPHKFDVIFANPPYIKQELIPNKKLMLKNLPLFASYRSIQNQSQRLSGQIPKVKLPLTAKTDYYGFFLWYSTYFLRENGMICFIIPNKWMDVKYGENIKEFLLSNYKILALIGFTKNVFQEAQVSTVIILAQKCSCKRERDSNIVKFLSLLDNSSRKSIHDIVYSKTPDSIVLQLKSQSYVFNNQENLHRTFVSQNKLVSDEKWSLKYLFQSKFAQILQKVPLIPMHNQEITSVVGGIKTGANDFYFPSSFSQTTFNIESQFLVPGIKSGRSLPKSFIVSRSDCVFLNIPQSIILEQFPGLQSYIHDGEQVKSYPKRPSIKWKPWYRIPPSHQDSPDILFLRHIDKNFRAIWNQLGCIVADGVRGLSIHDSTHILFYLGVCNSTFFYWQAHMMGRWEGQGDLQLLVYELKKFQIPDIRLIPAKNIQKVESSMKEIIDKTPRNSKSLKISSSLKKKLDFAVLACLKLDEHYNLLFNETQSMEAHRLNKKF